MNYKTEQESFWSGEFGDEYIGRNKGEASIASNTALFSKILKSTNSISSIIEFGANRGPTNRWRGTGQIRPVFEGLIFSIIFNLFIGFRLSFPGPSILAGVRPSEK